MSYKNENGASYRRQWWLEPAIVVLSLLVTGLLWQFLRTSEQAHINRMTNVVAEAMRADIEADMNARVASQRQLGRVWETAEDSTLLQMQSHAQEYLAHQPGCQSVDWVPPTGRTRRVAPPEASAAGGGSDPGIAPPLAEAMRAAIARKDATTAVILADGQRAQLASILPLYRQTAFRGLLVTTCDLKESFDDQLDDTKGLGYVVAISVDKHDVYRWPERIREGEDKWGQVVELKRPTTTFRLRVWPKPAMLANLDTHVPEAALFVGILLSILLAVSVHFAQNARAQSRRVDMANRKLSAEVTERRLTEAALKASQARLAGILEISADAVVSVDENQRVTLFNQGAEKTFGYRSEEVLGQHIDMLLPVQHRERHRRLIEEFGRAPAPNVAMSQRGQIAGRRKDGTEFPAEGSISKLELPEGKLFTAILRDVTEQVKAAEELRRSREDLEVRVQERTAELAAANAALQAEVAVRSEAEQALRESQGRLQAILDNSGAAIFMKDIEGRYILVNRYFEQSFHLPGDQIIGKTSREIFPAERADVLRAHDEEVLKTCAPIEFEEAVEHNGETRTYLAVKFPICDGQGKPFALCGISADITKRKQAEDSLRELSAQLLRLQDEERRRVARELHDSTGSHLFALSIYLSKAQALCRNEDAEMRKTLNDGIQSVENFSTEIRTLSYLLHPPLLDELGLVPALTSYVKGFGERSGISAKFAAQPNLGRLGHATELTIFRIVQEALTNIHHHSGSPSAEVAIARGPDGVAVTIRDQGRGFSPEMLAASGAGGVGIRGMRERVRQLGGTLEIQSGANGTVIRATLPDATVQRAAAAQS